MHKAFLISFTFLILSFTVFTLSTNKFHNKDFGHLKSSGAGIGLNQWMYERAYPEVNVQQSKYLGEALKESIYSDKNNDSLPGYWKNLGPENIGGRMLCMEFHPSDTGIIYAGSASGGLWKTSSGGWGRYAWEPVPTGFPLLGVSAISIDPWNPNVLIIGTGEVYGSGLAEPGTINRYVRGSYGIGILRTTDGGQTWTHVLDFARDSLIGVHDIETNPNLNSEVFAATSIGLYKSTDGGINWTKVFNANNCIDIEFDPNADSVVYFSQGNFNDALAPAACGIFKSTDHGDSFQELQGGLLNAWSGSSKLAIDPSNSNIIYASLQVSWYNNGSTTPGGIYKSTDAGATWTMINNQNMAVYQGWYSHDIDVNPNNSSELIQTGVDTWKSSDGGSSFIKKSFWNLWSFSQISVNSPEGGPNYVHADIHEIKYHPLIPNKLFLATDGGIFSSDDGGETFITHNGGLQTTQFYPSISSSYQDSAFVIGGTQDNATYVYRGDPSWYRVIGGDGMSTAVRPDDDNIVFGSAQNLFLVKSTDNGFSFSYSAPNLGSSEPVAFLAPYVISSIDNNIMFVGANYLYISVNGGDLWTPSSSNTPDGTNIINNIALSELDFDIMYISTSPLPLTGSTETPKIMKSDDGGGSFIDVSQNLPDRICKDIAIDPLDDNTVYAVFSGFGTDHVFRTTDGGNIWEALDNGLPDVPTNTILIDPQFTHNIYVGNDLGVYFSPDNGNSWTKMTDSLPSTTMVYDLNNSTVNRKIRIGTHGRGIYEHPFIEAPLTALDNSNLEQSNVGIYPNPGNSHFSIASIKDEAKVQILSLNGKIQNSLIIKQGERINTEHLNSGIYIIRIESDNGINSFKWIKLD